MLEHVRIPVKDHAKSKRLYAAMLVPLGYHAKYEMGDATGFMECGHTSVWIVQKEVDSYTSKTPPSTTICEPVM